MKIHETKDFYLCAVLVLEGYSLVDHNREQGFTVFSFQDTPELQRTISSYYLSKLLVDPSVYGLTLRQLKGVMHNSPSVSTQNHENNNNEQKGQQ
jgi:hypothetical protein